MDRIIFAVLALFESPIDGELTQQSPVHHHRPDDARARGIGKIAGSGARLRF
jgi:hypothetical protein